MRSARRVSAKRNAVLSSGTMSHSSLCGVKLTLPKLSGSRLEGSGLVEDQRLGARPLMLFAKRRMVSV